MIKNIIPKTKGAYLVGGSLRDLLLGRSPTDYDIAVLDNPEKFAKKIAADTQGHLVKMGKPGQIIYRVVSGKHIFDISSACGATIEDDLHNRDFTINAMAYSLYSGQIIDPAGGMQDLAGKKIRLVSKGAFKNDPIRLIRAFRIGALLDFEIESRTAAAVKDDAKLIATSAGERIRAELFKLLGSSQSHAYLARMADTGLLCEIFPELGRLKGCFQNKHHFFDVYEHTMRAYSHLETMLNDYNGCFGLQPEISDQIGRSPARGKAALLKCAILLHDIGKPLVRTVDDQGNVHFYGHAKKSAEMAKETGRRLKFSTREKGFIDFIVRHHMRPLFLYAAQAKLTRKGFTRFFIRCGDNLAGLLLHSIADVKGKGNSENEEFTAFAINMINDYYLQFKPQKSKPPLITGSDLINEFGLTPSPLFKTMLNLVEESRLSDTTMNRQAALKLVGDFLSGQRNLTQNLSSDLTI